MIHLKAIFLFGLLFPVLALCQIGKPFPSVATEMVSGKKVQLPSGFSAEFVLVGVGTSKKAEENLRTWQTPIYNKFIAKTGMMDDLYDVQVCFLPLFTGAAKAAKSKVMKKLRENNETVVIGNVYAYSGDRAPFKDFGLNERKEPYFFLLNEDGVVIWQAKGMFKQSYFDDIEDILTQ